MKQRIYIDTSVVGGYFDDEFSVDTIPFFELAKNGEIALTQLGYYDSVSQCWRWF